jgi:hypothetical protein
VQAKRAARAEARGFDFGAVDGRLAHFVATGGDMMVRATAVCVMQCSVLRCQIQQFLIFSTAI